MKYLCLVYQDEEKLNALSQGELDALVADSLVWVEELEQSGRHLFSAGLQSGRTAVTLRERDGSLDLADGPPAETREVLGSVILLSARDLNEALQLAAKLPAARFGSVEVRPLLEPDQEPTELLDRKLRAAFLRLVE